MAKRIKSREEVKNESLSNVAEPVFPDTNNSLGSELNLSQVVEESKQTLQTEKKKRTRRTKAELEAAGIPQSGRAGSSPHAGASGPNTFPNPAGRDRTNELKPAVKMYSKIFLADQIGIPALALDDMEAENFAKVTSDLMNAFPEYFNSSNPKVAALINVGIMLIPIAYSKYMIYAEAKRIQSLPEVKNNEVVMKQPQFQNTPLNGSAKNEADVLNSLASGGLPLANF